MLLVMQVLLPVLGSDGTSKSLCMLLQSYATIAIVPGSAGYYRGYACIEYASIEVCL